MQYLYIAVGGAAGAALRYLVSGWTYSLLGTGFPWGTLVVNLIGSFLIGFLWQLFADTTVSPNMRHLIFTGGLGIGCKWVQLDLSAQISTEEAEFDGNTIPRHARAQLALVSKWL